jgi:hypothetical protein
MHCDQCGKENRLSSKFCKHCGTTLTESVKTGNGKTKTLQKKLVTKFLIILVVLGVLSFGAYKAYAYHQVQSRINNAKKLQGNGDYAGSLSILNSLGNYSPTTNQLKIISALKTNDQKFDTFKTAFTSAVALENSSSSDDLQTAITDLQTIDSSYPFYKDVQSEIAKDQGLLVTALQDKVDASTKAANDAKAQVANAQAQAAASVAAKARAEADTQKAQSEASQQIAQQQEKDVLVSFVNQLQSAYTDFNDNAISEYNDAIDQDNAGEILVAVADYGQVIASDNGVYGTVSSMLSNFTNLPDSYSTAAKDLKEAVSYETEAAQAASSADADGVNDSTTINYYSGLANTYKTAVHNFLVNPQ